MSEDLEEELPQSPFRDDADMAGEEAVARVSPKSLHQKSLSRIEEESHED